HIEIFEKEVSIFRECLLLFDQMLTSFSEKPGSFHSQSRLSRRKSPAFHLHLPGFACMFLPVAPFL
ncbi:hypothetical protein K0H20_19215, partial [Bacteroides fragilis]|nr:hypothetical protein [Bacteroides fragilis]MCE8701687.1 hypothetical protein [Bacteroides fragilis]MCE9327609.1 hypothetical protein [Bacteroides fragilis]MCE9449363.1 hypothetical protein [Bacteroides fragilis]